MNKSEKIKWGIIGAGNIAESFAGDLRYSKNSELYAVASASPEKLDKFREKYSPRKLYSSYNKLFCDKDVEIVYISTPHSFHYEHTMQALSAGKNVLCEKPFAINFKQAEQMFETAEKSNPFLMEAMWTRFLPAFVKIKSIIDSGEIGEVKQINADFGFFTEFDKESRLFNPALGGGSLLDVGVYPLTLAYSILGMPEKVEALAHIGKSGVDEQISFIFIHKNGAISNLNSAINLETPQEALIIGTAGKIHIKREWWRTIEFSVEKNGKTKNYNEKFKGLGYQFEADHCAECIAIGLIESSIHTKNDSLNIMKLIDIIRSKINLKYPLLFE